LGPDIAYVAEINGLTVPEVIALHIGPLYRVYMLGFTPGFPYLGGLAERIRAPRRATPRTEVAAGSVGIANDQTGIYPLKSPGGWQIIGRTPVKLFSTQKEPPALLAAGDGLRFYPVSREEFDHLQSREEG
jgi:KipI family sensor histidine kinase inhibitor